jgi:large subunit ribosomal protein L21
MYAVVKSGGKQYKVKEGDTLQVEKLPAKVGAEIAFDDVLMFSDGETVQVGTPNLDNVTVKGTVVEQGQAKKIIVFKYKRRKRYRRKQGHRQQYTAVKVDSITSN